MITLKLKSNGDEVYILQRMLRKVGYVIVADGDFGAKTEKAVRDFQFSNSLIADGIVGSRTWDLLFARAYKLSDEILGIDLFHHDETNSDGFWEEVRDKYAFCFVKASEGSTFSDPSFLDHIKALKEHRILRGGYHFFRMMNEDVDGQIQNFLDSGVDFREKGFLPPVLDVEPSSDEWKNQKILTANRADIIKRMQKWLTVIESKTGKRPIIYTTKHIWDNILKAPSNFSKYSLWVADYTEGATKPQMPMGWKSWAIWQYSENGTIGTADNIDLNKLNITYRDLLKIAGY